MSKKTFSNAGWFIAGLSVIGSAWVLSGAPAISAVSTQAAVAATAAPSPAGLPEFRDIVKDNQPSIVRISTKQAVRDASLGDDESPFGDDDDNPLPEPFRHFFNNPGNNGRAPGGRQFQFRGPPMREAEALGSGFIISTDGKILTNAHVVDGADTVTVTMSDKTEYEAKVLGKDKQTDVAVLKIDAKNLRAVKFGNSDQLSVGEWVLAIGSPYGLDYSATQGIVSALGRRLPNENYVPFIQTDAAVNPGNSGGPLFNTRGEVVGINSQIYTRTGGYQGLSFAIPINTVQTVAVQLEKSGRVSRGWLGVQIQTVNSDLAKSFGMDKPRGALVGNVDDNSPAGKAGVQTGDIIVSFDGHAVESSSELPPLVGSVPAGHSVEMKVLRDGKEVTLHPTIGNLKDDSQQLASADVKPGKALLNIVVQPLDNDTRKQRTVREGGVLVAQVNPGPAARAGITAGDIIVKVGNKAVDDPAQFTKLIQSLPRGKPVAFLIERQGSHLYMAVNIPEEKSKKDSQNKDG
ncbi:MAG TPA: DegQ family serine endoprotease [Steroidobacteraceae bacterium]|jgi:serine protease Do|nr:DegQ family serine endoprotease [Steroidobacteraceae bacterium]